MTVDPSTTRAIGTREIASILGVSQRQVQLIIARDQTFPPALKYTKRDCRRLLSDVLLWLETQRRSTAA